MLTEADCKRKREEYFERKEKQDALAMKIVKLFEGYELQEAERILGLAKSLMNKNAIVSSVCEK